MSLGNLILLCPAHHRRVHEGGYEIRRDHRGGWYFRRPDGRAATAHIRRTVFVALRSALCYR
ncbi:MAG: hypothetical protein PVF50_07210 [Gammaproteobacteria bacterium]|jgi:hypothetical protein